MWHVTCPHLAWCWAWVWPRLCWAALSQQIGHYPPRSHYPRSYTDGHGQHPGHCQPRPRSLSLSPARAQGWGQPRQWRLDPAAHPPLLGSKQVILIYPDCHHDDITWMSDTWLQEEETLSMICTEFHNLCLSVVLFFYMPLLVTSVFMSSDFLEAWPGPSCQPLEAGAETRNGWRTR